MNDWTWLNSMTRREGRLRVRTIGRVEPAPGLVWACYNYPDHEIWVPPLLNAADLICALHEQGHAVCGHKGTPMTMGPGDVPRVVQMEVEAWHFALRCIKQQHQTLACMIALTCLRTYSRAFLGLPMYDDQALLAMLAP